MLLRRAEANLRQAPEWPRKIREQCRATPGAMRFSVACLVVWPELWMTRGDPRLGKRPFIESHRPIDLYTHITRCPPRLCNTYHSRRCCRALHSTTRKLSHTGPQSPDVSPSPTLPATDTLSSYQSQHETATDSPLLLSLGGQQPTLTIGSPPYLLHSITLLQVRTPKGRDSPDRYDNPRGTFIPTFFVENPFAFPQGLVDYQHRRQTSIDQTNTPFHALTASTPVHHHIST